MLVVVDSLIYEELGPPLPPRPPPPLLILSVFHDVIIISIITSISINVITIITSLFFRKILGPPSPSCYPPFIIIIVNCPCDGGVRMEPFGMMFAAQSGHLNAVLGFVTFCDRSQTGSCSRCGFRSVCQFVC